MSTTDFSAKFDLRSSVQDARATARTSEDSVLDVLVRNSEIPVADLKRLLQAQGGVLVALDDDLVRARSHDHSEILRKWGAVSVGFSDTQPHELLVAAADPWEPDLRAQVDSLLGRPASYVCVTGQKLRALRESGAPAVGNQLAPAPTLSTMPDAPADTVIGFVNEAMTSAFASGASDVHFEYSRDGLAVKFRQDGILVPHSILAGTTRADEVISRIKVLAQLDITERRVPQDGRFRFQFGDRNIDMRVSIMPSIHGEDAVLRLLDKAQLRGDAPISLRLLGFDEESVAALQSLAELPHGMMLVTGPTGSGKTTTVYAILSEVNNGQEKIITIEDPVEYELQGVLQIPVSERKNLTFAKGLRSILRHDPDRILVGEIRDAETAEIAVQSALTGHQVFTTVHANSILDVTGRFRHFGLDMFGFMSALNGVVVQRLVRKLCLQCGSHRLSTDAESRWLLRMGVPLDKVPVPVGCDRCRGTGYKGRLVISEVHAIDDIFRDLVTTNAPVSQLREHLARQSGRSLGTQAARLVQIGLTSSEEVKRVVGWR